MDDIFFDFEGMTGSDLDRITLDLRGGVNCLDGTPLTFSIDFIPDNIQFEVEGTILQFVARSRSEDPHYAQVQF